MKKSIILCAVLRTLSMALVVGLLNPSTTQAGTVTSWDLFYSHFFDQVDANAPASPAAFTFTTRIFLDAPLATAEALLFLPGPQDGVSMGTTGDFFMITENFNSQTSLDQAYPAGQYGYTLNSPDLTPVTGESAFLTVPATPPPFANTPYFTNFGGIQNVDAAAPFKFSWIPATGQTTPFHTEVFFTVTDTTLDTTVVDAFYPDTSVTSYDVPANLLTIGHNYLATLYFSVRNPTAGSGFANVDGLLGYDNATNLTFFVKPAPTDFDSDGHSDYVLYNPSNLRTQIWHLDGKKILSKSQGPKLRSGLSLAGLGDIDHDGHSDFVLSEAGTGRTPIWYMNDTAHLDSGHGPIVPAGWAIAGVADFNGDGNLDYLLFNASSLETMIYYLNGSHLVTSLPGPTLPTGYVVGGVADFDGDGKPDLVLYNPSNRRTTIWTLDNNAFVSALPGRKVATDYTLAGVVDSDGDGHPDYVLFNPSTLRTVIWHFNGTQFLDSEFGPTLPAGWSLFVH